MKNKTPVVDYHVHSEYSFDWPTRIPGSIFDICENAIKNGISQIAITDHMESNWVLAGDAPILDAASLRQDVMSAKKAFGGKLDIIYGVELGQPTQAPEIAQQLLDSFDFEFVIGSYHNNVGVKDFALIDYANTPAHVIQDYYMDYLNQTADHINWGIGKFSALGHLGYPLRYLAVNNLSHIINPYDEKYMKATKHIFSLIIKHGIALEVNTSGWRQGLNNSMATDGMIQYYADMGGKLITIGTDSHDTQFIGSNVEKQYGILYNLGIREISTFKNGSRNAIKL